MQRFEKSDYEMFQTTFVHYVSCEAESKSDRQFAWWAEVVLSYTESCFPT